LGPQARKPKTIQFDQSKILENVRVRLSLVDKLQSASDELIKVAGEVMKSAEASSILQKLNDTTKGLALMAYLGYGETRVLESAVNMVPKSYGEMRISRICKILNHFRTIVKKPAITESTVEKLLPVFADVYMWREI